MKLHVALSLTPEEYEKLGDGKIVLTIKDAQGVEHVLTPTTGAAVIDLNGDKAVSFTFPKPESNRARGW